MWWKKDTTARTREQSQTNSQGNLRTGKQSRMNRRKISGSEKRGLIDGITRDVTDRFLPQESSQEEPTAQRTVRTDSQRKLRGKLNKIVRKEVRREVRRELRGQARKNARAKARAQAAQGKKNLSILEKRIAQAQRVLYLTSVAIRILNAFDQKMIFRK